MSFHSGQQAPAIGHMYSLKRSVSAGCINLVSLWAKKKCFTNRRELVFMVLSKRCNSSAAQTTVWQSQKLLIHYWNLCLPNFAAKLSSHLTSSVYGGLLEKLLGWSLWALRPNISNASIPERACSLLDNTANTMNSSTSIAMTNGIRPVHYMAQLYSLWGFEVVRNTPQQRPMPFPPCFILQLG